MPEVPSRDGAVEPMTKRYEDGGETRPQNAEPRTWSLVDLINRDERRPPLAAALSEGWARRLKAFEILCRAEADAPTATDVVGG